MNFKYILLIFIISFINANGSYAAFHDRSEIKKYTLYKDRIDTDRYLMKDRYKHFLELDLFFSSGIKKIYGDISDALDSSQNSIAKQVNVASVLSKNINTEKFIDIDLVFGSPLPYIKIKKHKFLPGLFVNINAGTLFSFNNKANALDPKANIYLKKDIKYGINTKYKWNSKNEYVDFSIYKMLRSDIDVSKTASQIVAEDSFIDLDELTQDEKFIALDLKYGAQNGRSSYILEMREFKLLKSPGSKDSRYGTTPYLRMEFERLFSPEYGLSFFVGEHYRQRYNVLEGLYAGIKMRPMKSPPLGFVFKFDIDFLTFMPQLKMKWLVVDYKVKIPHRNPQDEVWASTIHSLSVNIPFP